MKEINEIALILFARLGSTRIKQKMIKPFCDTSLLEISIKKILKSAVIPKENIYLFAYETELINIGTQYGVNILQRSEQSANAESNIKEIHEWHDKLDYKYVTTFNACAPLLSIETIDDFLRYYMKSEYEGLFSVIEKKNFFWDTNHNLLTDPPKNRHAPNTKTMNTVYEASHCLYASKVEWLKEGKWLGSFSKPNDPELYIMSEDEAFDIDYPWQFEIGEMLYSKLTQLPVES